MIQSQNSPSLRPAEAAKRTNEMPCVLVIVPVFNRLTTTQACLDDLRSQTYCNIKIVVVDGGSTDGTPDVVRSTYADVKLYANEGTLWWTDAVALAVEREVPSLRGSDYVFLLNNDTVLRSDTIQRLIKTSCEQGGAVVAAAVKEISGRAIAAGSKITWGLSLGEPIGHENFDLGDNGVIDVDVVFGRATLIPVNAFSRVGNFDAKRFPQYYGDSDFFLRASRAGLRVVIDCRTIVSCREDESSTGVHFVGGEEITLRRVWQMATSVRSNLNLATALRFAWRHAPGWHKPLSAFALLQRNLSTMVQLYFGRFWIYRQVRQWASWILSAPPFSLVSNFLRLQPLYLNFSELRRRGFDPVEMRRKGEIRLTGIPHTYHLHVPRLRMLADRRRFMPLILRNYNPCITLRVRRFVKARARSRSETAGLAQAALPKNFPSQKN